MSRWEIETRMTSTFANCNQVHREEKKKQTKRNEILVPLKIPEEEILNFLY
jgi:hypothetical protein